MIIFSINGKSLYLLINLFLNIVRTIYSYVCFGNSVKTFSQYWYIHKIRHMYSYISEQM